jgi:3-hydroxybutyryl-CoA dehydratase
VVIGYPLDRKRNRIMFPSIGMKEEFTKTILESDVALFAGISGDMNPIHIDAVTAKKSIFGERIVHGALVSGLISAVIGMKLPGPGTIYLEQDSKFKMPVKIGDTITASVEVVEIINPEKGILKLSTKCINQKDDIVIDGYAIVKVVKT